MTYHDTASDSEDEAKTPNTSDNNEENRAVDQSLTMAMEEIDNYAVVVDTAGDMGLNNGVMEADGDAGDGPSISHMIKESGMRRRNRNLDVTTDWKMFPAAALYDDEDDGEPDLMVGQGGGLIVVPWKKAGL